MKVINISLKRKYLKECSRFCVIYIHQIIVYKHIKRFKFINY